MQVKSIFLAPWALKESPFDPCIFSVRLSAWLQSFLDCQKICIRLLGNLHQTLRDSQSMSIKTPETLRQTLDVSPKLLGLSEHLHQTLQISQQILGISENLPSMILGVIENVHQTLRESQQLLGLSENLNLTLRPTLGVTSKPLWVPSHLLGLSENLHQTIFTRIKVMKFLTRTREYKN